MPEASEDPHVEAAMLGHDVARECTMWSRSPSSGARTGRRGSASQGTLPPPTPRSATDPRRDSVFLRSDTVRTRKNSAFSACSDGCATHHTLGLLASHQVLVTHPPLCLPVVKVVAGGRKKWLGAKVRRLHNGWWAAGQAHASIHRRRSDPRSRGLSRAVCGLELPIHPFGALLPFRCHCPRDVLAQGIVACSAPGPRGIAWKSGG